MDGDNGTQTLGWMQKAKPSYTVYTRDISVIRTFEYDKWYHNYQ